MKKKMIKRVLSLMLAGIFAFGMTGDCVPAKEMPQTDLEMPTVSEDAVEAYIPDDDLSEEDQYEEISEEELIEGDSIFINQGVSPERAAELE